MRFLLVFLALSTVQLVYASNRVNLQWTVCEKNVVSVAHLLNITSKSKNGFITYFDANPARYFTKGVSFRTKENTDTPLTSSVKVRSQDFTDSAKKDCEWDQYGSDKIYTCEVEGQNITPNDPWTTEQKDFVENYVNVSWSDLNKIGPYPTVAWKTKLIGYNITLDSVNLPAPLLPLIEISTKVSDFDADQDYQTLSNQIKKAGIQLCHLQEPKTKRLFREIGW